MNWKFQINTKWNKWPKTQLTPNFWTVKPQIANYLLEMEKYSLFPKTKKNSMFLVKPISFRRKLRLKENVLLLQHLIKFNTA